MKNESSVDQANQSKDGQESAQDDGK